MESTIIYGCHMLHLRFWDRCFALSAYLPALNSEIGSSKAIKHLSLWPKSPLQCSFSLPPCNPVFRNAMQIVIVTRIYFVTSPSELVSCTTTRRTFPMSVFSMAHDPWNIHDDGCPGSHAFSSPNSSPPQYPLKFVLLDSSSDTSASISLEYHISQQLLFWFFPQ